jgi:hypothetical protein
MVSPDFFYFKKFTKRAVSVGLAALYCYIKNDSELPLPPQLLPTVSFSLGYG